MKAYIINLASFCAMNLTYWLLHSMIFIESTLALPITGKLKIQVSVRSTESSTVDFNSQWDSFLNWETWVPAQHRNKRRQTVRQNKLKTIRMHRWFTIPSDGFWVFRMLRPNPASTWIWPITAWVRLNQITSDGPPTEISYLSISYMHRKGFPLLARLSLRLPSIIAGTSTVSSEYIDNYIPHWYMYNYFALLHVEQTWHNLHLPAYFLLFPS